MNDESRYNGKPLLRLLELYVLKAIDELSQADKQALYGMAPKLQLLYGGNGQWHEAIAAAVNIPSGAPNAIREMWARNLEIARVNNVTLLPQMFAEMFVDENFMA